jgi:HlyD family secretion protein
LTERIEQTRNEVDGLSAQAAAKEKELAFISKEFDGVQDLYKKNLVTIVRYTQLQRDKARLEGERGQLVAEIARARGKIAETELQILNLDQDFRTEVLKELREAQSRISELKERALAAQDELNRVDIRAPQSGVVYQLSAHTVGGVIARGDPVMLIVPESAKLIIEARVAPTDIDQVTVGAKVRVRVAAGNRRTMPDVEGAVTHVAPDLTREQQGGPSGPVTQAFYNVRVSLSEAQKQRLEHLQLVPGMQTEVFILTDNRTPLDYLMKPLQEQIARTFRER